MNVIKTPDIQILLLQFAGPCLNPIRVKLAFCLSLLEGESCWAGLVTFPGVHTDLILEFPEITIPILIHTGI